MGLELTDKDRTAFGRVLGMKAREILAAEEVPGGYVVTTHDHQRTFVDIHGQVGGAAPAAPPAAAVPEEPSVAKTSGEGGGQGPDDGTAKSSTAEGSVPEGSVPSGGTPGGGAPEGAQVPDGSEREVLAWVDGDQDRAAAALRVEEARETPRKGLLGKLQQLVG